MNQGPISIIDAKKEESGSGGGNTRKVRNTQYAIQLLISVIVSISLILFLAPSKTSIEAKSTKLAADIATAITNLSKSTNDAIATMNSKYASLESALNAKLASTDAAVTAKLSGVDTTINNKAGAIENSLNLKISSLESSVNSKTSAIDSKVTVADSKISGLVGLDSRVSAAEQKVIAQDAKITAALNGIDAKVASAVTDKMSTLEARIKALETPTIASSTSSGLVATSGALTAILKTYGGVILASGTNKLQSQVKLTVTNNGSTDIDDLMVAIAFWPQYTTPSIDTALSSSLTGGTTNWVTQMFSSNGMMFRTTAPGMRIRAGTTKSWFLDLVANYTTNATWDIEFDPEIEIE